MIRSKGPVDTSTARPASLHWTPPHALSPAAVVAAVDPLTHVTVDHVGRFGRAHTTHGIATSLQWRDLRVAQLDAPRQPTIEIPVRRIHTITLEDDVSAAELGVLHDSGVDPRREFDRAAKLRELADFQSRDIWSECRAAIRTELAQFRRSVTTAKLRTAYLRAHANTLTARIQSAYGVRAIGYHYNTHGGGATDYMIHGGIRARLGGDVMLQYSPHGHRAESVYYFSSDHHPLFDVLDARHGDHLLRTRMGSVLMLFDLAHPLLAEARAAGAATNFSEICLDFDLGWVRQHRHYPDVGIPNEAFLLPPLEVYSDTATRLGCGRLSWDEETLVTLRYLEAALFPAL